MTAYTSEYPELEMRFGPDASLAFRFVLAGMKDCAWYDQPHATNIIRYWVGDESIFITHLRWKIASDPEVNYEISRTEAIDNWISAIETYTRVASAHDEMPKLSRGASSDPAFHDLTHFLMNLHYTIRMASAFFATLADIESSKLIPSTWPDPTMFAPTSIVDPSAPAILWSYTVIKALGVAHCDVNTKTVDEVIQRSRIHVEPIIALSINAQESSREWKHRIEIVDEREKAPELEASGDNSPPTSSPTLGTPVGPSPLGLMASGRPGTRLMKHHRKNQAGGRSTS